MPWLDLKVAVCHLMVQHKTHPIHQLEVALESNLFLQLRQKPKNLLKLV